MVACRNMLNTILLLCTVALMSCGSGHEDTSTLAEVNNAGAKNNFIVSTNISSLNPVFQKKLEEHRKSLAVEWLGKELDDWEHPVAVTARVDPKLKPGGMTSFNFSSSVPVDVTMSVFGSEFLLRRAVLPHEVMHTVFATYFGRPVPRWADEGVCTLNEGEEDQKKSESDLRFYSTQRRLFKIKVLMQAAEYPKDILTFYAQGTSLSRYLIELDDKAGFVSFLKSVLNQNDTEEAQLAALKDFYGFESYEDLEKKWWAWQLKRFVPVSVLKPK